MAAGRARRRPRVAAPRRSGARSRPPVGVVGGSRSDFPILEKAVALLTELGIPNELRVVSAHRTPDLLYRYAEEAPGRGIRVIVAGAGGAAHLPGMLAAKTILPGHRRADPDPASGRPRLAPVHRPDAPRIPVATVAIGNAENAALLAAEILALSDPALAARRGRVPGGADPGRPRRRDEPGLSRRKVTWRIAAVSSGSGGSSIDGGPPPGW